MFKSTDSEPAARKAAFAHSLKDGTYLAILKITKKPSTALAFQSCRNACHAPICILQIAPYPSPLPLQELSHGEADKKIEREKI